MDRLSLVGGSFAGFGLIRRAPVAVLVWSALYGLLILAPLIWFFMSVIPEFFALAKVDAEALATRPQVFPAEMMTILLRMQLFNLISLIGRLVWTAIFCAAVMRAVLRPQDKAHFYLRLGVDELWQALIVAVLSIGGYVILLLLLVPALILILIGAALSPWAALAAAVLAVPVTLGVFIWFALRMCMAMPLTFADRQFRLIESWSFTRGHAGALAGMGFVTAVTTILLQMVGGGLVAAPIVLGVLAQSADGGAWLADTLTKNPGLVLQRLAPWLAVSGVVLTVTTGVTSVVWAAPWVEAYRRIAADKAEPA